MVMVNEILKDDAQISILTIIFPFKIYEYDIWPRFKDKNYCCGLIFGFMIKI
jgi:hypothetical protein